MATKKFVVGDIHGQLDLFQMLEKHIREQCAVNGDDYVIMCTGDIMDRGPQSFEAYKYFRANPRLFTLLGNHDHFYVDDTADKVKRTDLDPVFAPVGMYGAFLESNGGEQTFANMFEYYRHKPLPQSNDKTLDKTAFEAKWAYDNHLRKSMNAPENSRLLDKIKSEYLTDPTSADTVLEYLAQLDGWQTASEAHYNIPAHKSAAYSADDARCIMFLATVLQEMREYFQTQPLLKTLEEKGEKYVLTHSGYVPLNEKGAIIDISGLDADERKAEQRAMLTFREKKTARYSGERVHGGRYIILHGHTPERETNGTDICSVKNGNLVRVNLDGDANGIASTQRLEKAGKLGKGNCPEHFPDNVIRCLELGSDRFLTIDHKGIINAKTAKDYNPEYVKAQNVMTQ